MAGYPREENPGGYAGTLYLVPTYQHVCVRGQGFMGGNSMPCMGTQIQPRVYGHPPSQLFTSKLLSLENSTWLLRIFFCFVAHTLKTKTREKLVIGSLCMAFQMNAASNVARGNGHVWCVMFGAYVSTYAARLVGTWNIVLWWHLVAKFQPEVEFFSLLRIFVSTHKKHNFLHRESKDGQSFVWKETSKWPGSFGYENWLSCMFFCQNTRWRSGQ